ncbi:hypothetical protein ACFXAZ_37005 [Streptomyces sp. NPDC059477]|uniref:hypothetical protein n=1 Tax=Streptomyces sp. NPDC059477 TaxID=3346847 RepID=UPI0036942AC5
MSDSAPAAGWAAPGPELEPKTASGLVAAVAGMLAATAVAAPIALVAQGVAALTGGDQDKAVDAVMKPTSRAVEKFIDAADKHNETIVKAGITAAVGAIAHGSSSKS